MDANTAPRKTVGARRITYWVRFFAERARCVKPHVDENAALQPVLTGSSADCILNPSNAYPASCNPRRYGSRIFISSAISLAVFPASSRASSFAPAETRRSIHGREALMVAQCSGVRWELSVASTDAPCFSKRSMEIASPAMRWQGPVSGCNHSRRGMVAEAYLAKRPT